MTSARRTLLMNALKLYDLGLMILAFVLAGFVMVHQTHNASPTAFFAMRVKIQNFAIFAVLILLWHLIFRFSGLYASRRLSKRGREAVDVVTSTSVGTFVIFVGGITCHLHMVTPLFLLVFWLTSTGLTVPSRLVLRMTLAALRKRGRNLRDIIIIGTNGRALEFANRLVSHTELGYRISGFVDQEWCGLEDFQRSGYALVSDIASFPAFLRRNVVDEVVIALPFRSMHEWASRIARVCEEQGVTVRVLSNIFDLKIGRRAVEELEEEDALLAHSAGWADGWPIFAKRILDLVISGIALIVLFPLLLLAAILIKVTSPGPIFFIQKRVGLHKRPLNVFKFRTMTADAEKRLHEIEHLNEVSGPVFKIKNDPRITPLGKILRKTSIDELPQLFNVFKGEMSLVGPRPLPVRDYEGFSEDWQRRRFSVKPGITCLWQVRGRSSIPFEQWMELDLQYIEKWSLWLDVQILLRTIPAVLRGSGAA
ncbi:MAG TPA: sugar transferase [Bryobacteraceae bacterium]|nr:sugar transferase [Bryobacteraceae bacterium]